MWMIAIGTKNYRLMGFTIFLMVLGVYLFLRHRRQRQINQIQQAAIQAALQHVVVQANPSAETGVPDDVRKNFHYFKYEPRTKLEDLKQDEEKQATEDVESVLPYTEPEHCAWANEEFCSICLCNYEPDNVLCQLMPCAHVYHSSCIEAWIAAHNHCPMCKALLTPQATDSEPVIAHGV